MDAGFKQEGFECVRALDIDPLAISVHKHNLRSPASVCDLNNINGELSRLPAKLDVLIATPPCQGFSTAGKRDVDDPRNHLLIRAAEIAKELKPCVFIMENVTGVIAGRHRVYWDSVRDALRNANYQTVDMRCDTSAHGVAQRRRRQIMLAWNDGRHVSPSVASNRPRMVLRDSLAGVRGADGHHPKYLLKGSDAFRIARRIQPGQKLCNVRGGDSAVHTWQIPEVFGRTTRLEQRVLATLLHLRRRLRQRDFGDADPVLASDLTNEVGRPCGAILEVLVGKGYVRKIGRRYDLTHTFNGKYRRLCWDRPSPTVDTRFGDPRYFLHPDEPRGFSVREAARIQGFSDTFVFFGSEREQFRMIGNAVPPPFGASLARFVRASLLD